MDCQILNIAGQDYIGVHFLSKDWRASIWGDSWEIYPTTRDGIKTDIQCFYSIFNFFPIKSSLPNSKIDPR